MKDKWAKDVCPFCKDQGFDSIVGDPKPGETVIGITHTMVGAADTLDFLTYTAKEYGPHTGISVQNTRIIHQMADLLYRVFISRADEGDEATDESNSTYIGTKTLTSFVVNGIAGHTYDIIVVGRVNF